MNIDQLRSFEHTCQIAAQSSNLQEKQSGEQQVFSYISNRQNLQEVIGILNQTQHSIVRFVVLEYLSKLMMGSEQTAFKYLDYVPKTFESRFITLSQHKHDSSIEVQSDHKENYVLKMPLFQEMLSFLINHHSSLDRLSINSACNLVSQLIRLMWLETEDHEQIIQKIYQAFFEQNITLEKIGMTLLYCLITNTTAYSFNLGYLQFRKLMNTFQNNGLNNIVLYSVQSLKKVFVQYLESNQNNRETMDYLKSAVKLYLACVSFNFNASYFEYDHEGDTSDLQNISFPFEWKVIFQDITFYQNLFMVFLQLYRQNQQELAMKILYAITKMVSVRQLIFQDKENKKAFIQTTLQAITLLFQNFQTIDEDLFLELIEVNIKFIQNFQVQKLIKNQYFEAWLNMLKDFSIFLIHNSQTKLVNKLLNKNFELWSLIIVQSQKNHKISAEVQESFKQYGIQIAQNAISRLLTSTDPFFEDFSYKSHKKFKNSMKKFFENLSELFQLNYMDNIKIIDESLNQIISNQNIYVMNNQQQNLQEREVKLAYEKLIICVNLINQTVLVKIGQKKYFQYMDLSNFGDEGSEQLDPISGQILANCFRFIQFDANFNKQVISPPSYYVDNQLTLLTFLESYLTLTLEEIDKNFEVHDTNLKINNKYLPTNMDYQSVIEIVTHKLLNNLQIKNKLIIQYTLATLKTSLFKIKREISRAVFTKLPLIQHISNQLMELNNTALNEPEFYKLRVQVFELIAILWLDDYHDNYLESTDKVISSIKDSLGNQGDRLQIIKFIRDSTGICQYLDVAKIFKYYIKTAFPFYQEVFSQQIAGLWEDLEVINPALSFLLALFTNKCQRYTYDCQSNLGYYVFINMSEFLIAFGTRLKTQIISQGWLDNGKEMDQKVKLSNKLWEIMNAILRGKYINFGVFELFHNGCCVEYIKNMLELKFLLFDLIFLYPKCMEKYIDNILYLTDMAAETLFESLETQYVSNLFLLAEKMLRKIVETELKDPAHAALDTASTLFNSEANFTKISTIVYNICQFCYEECNVKYSPRIQRNVQEFLTSNRTLIHSFIHYLFDLSFNVYKIPKVISKVSKTLFSLVVIDQNSFNQVQTEMVQKISQNLTESDYLIKQFATILTDVQMKFDTINEDKFQKNLKKAIDSIQQNYAIKENTIQIIPS